MRLTTNAVKSSYDGDRGNTTSDRRGVLGSIAGPSTYRNVARRDAQIGVGRVSRADSALPEGSMGQLHALETALVSGSCFQPVEHHEPCDAVDRAEREISEQQAEAGVEGRSTCVEPRGRDAACEWDALRDRGDNAR